MSSHSFDSAKDRRVSDALKNLLNAIGGDSYSDSGTAGLSLLNLGNRCKEKLHGVALEEGLKEKLPDIIAAIRILCGSEEGIDWPSHAWRLAAERQYLNEIERLTEHLQSGVRILSRANELLFAEDCSYEESKGYLDIDFAAYCLPESFPTVEEDLPLRQERRTENAEAPDRVARLAFLKDRALKALPHLMSRPELANLEDILGALVIVSTEVELGIGPSWYEPIPSIFIECEEEIKGLLGCFASLLDSDPGYRQATRALIQKASSVARRGEASVSILDIVNIDTRIRRQGEFRSILTAAFAPDDVGSISDSELLSFFFKLRECVDSKGSFLSQDINKILPLVKALGERQEVLASLEAATKAGRADLSRLFTCLSEQMYSPGACFQLSDSTAIHRIFYRLYPESVRDIFSSICRGEGSNRAEGLKNLLEIFREGVFAPELFQVNGAEIRPTLEFATYLVQKLIKDTDANLNVPFFRFERKELAARIDILLTLGISIPHYEECSLIRCIFVKDNGFIGNFLKNFPELEGDYQLLDESDRRYFGVIAPNLDCGQLLTNDDTNNILDFLSVVFSYRDELSRDILVYYILCCLDSASRRAFLNSQPCGAWIVNFLEAYLGLNVDDVYRTVHPYSLEKEVAAEIIAWLAKQGDVFTSKASFLNLSYWPCGSLQLSDQDQMLWFQVAYLGGSIPGIDNFKEEFREILEGATNRDLEKKYELESIFRRALHSDPQLSDLFERNFFSAWRRLSELGARLVSTWAADLVPLEGRRRMRPPRDLNLAITNVQKVEELLQGSPFIKRVLKSGVFPGLIFTDSFIHSSALIRRGRIEGVQSYFLEGARLWHKANLFVDRLRKGAPSESRVRRDKQNSCLVGREFDSYVNYSPGMDPRGVDWRAYARTDRLVFKRGVSVVDLSRAHTVFYLDRDLKDGDSTQRIYDLIAHLYRHEIGQKSRIPQSLEIRLGYGSLFTIQADHLREILLKDNLISDRYGSRSQLVDLLLSLQFLDESFVEKEGLSGGSWIGPVPIESAVPISKHMIFNVWAPEDCFFHPDSSSFIKRISASGSVLYRYTT